MDFWNRVHDIDVRCCVRGHHGGGASFNAVRDACAPARSIANCADTEVGNRHVIIVDVFGHDAVRSRSPEVNVEPQGRWEVGASRVGKTRVDARVEVVVEVAAQIITEGIAAEHVVGD